MKNLLYIFLGLSLIFGCSDDSPSDDNSDDSNDGNAILCTKRTQQYENNGGEQIIRTYEYEYAGTQLLRWVRTTSGYAADNYQNQTVTYTNIYVDNLVTSMNVTIDASNDGTINNIYSYEFEYDNLGRKIAENRDGQFQKFYSYLNDGLTVQITSSEGQLQEIHTYDSNKNLIEREFFDSNGLYDGSTIYNLDNKNMPFKNVTTWYPLSFYLYTGIHNTITAESSNDDCIYTYDYSYDDNNYPISHVSTNNCSNTIRTYTYEYNN